MILNILLVLILISILFTNFWLIAIFGLLYNIKLKNIGIDNRTHSVK
jgi:hypothetical protein